MFMDGQNSQTPIILGSIAKTEYPTSVQAARRDDLVTNPFVYDLNKQTSQAVAPAELSFDQDLSDGQVSTKFFIDNGYTVDQAASISGVISHVSKFDPSNNTGDGYGLMGWRNGSNRLNSLKDFAGGISRQEKSWNSFDIQLLFILQELRTTQSAAQGRLRQATSAYVQGDRLTSRGGVASMIRYYMPNKDDRNVEALVGAGTKSLLYVRDIT
jgi:hypothetical protein